MTTPVDKEHNVPVEINVEYVGTEKDTVNWFKITGTFDPSTKTFTLELTDGGKGSPDKPDAVLTQYYWFNSNADTFGDALIDGRRPY